MAGCVQRERLLIVAFGTRGDVEPALAVAAALEGHGVDTRVAVPSDFVDEVGARGLESVDLQVSALEMLSSDVGRAWVQESHRSPRAGLRGLRTMFTAFGSRVARALLAEHRPDEAIASNVLTFGIGAALAEARGVPHLQLLLAPISPTGSAASSSAPFVTRVGFVDRLVGRVGLRAIHWASAPPVSEVRADLRLRPWRARDHVSAWMAIPVVYGFSRHVVPCAPDWSDQTTVTGYWHGEAAQTTPPPELADFIRSASEPVYIGFGSMSYGLDSHDTVELSCAAAEIAGVQAIVLSPGDARQVTSDGRNCLVGAVDHAWLFPQMSAVVHHGGAGTTAQAVRSGVPSTAVPRLGDQLFWGRRLAELGVGAPPLSPERLTAPALASAIRTMIDDPAMVAHARSLADRLRSEPGADLAAETIVAVLRSSSATPR